MSTGLDRAKAILAHQLNAEEHPAVRQEKLLLVIAELLADIAESLRNTAPIIHQAEDATSTYAPGAVVRVVGGEDVPDWMNGESAVVKKWDGSKYQMLVRNQSGAPWYVWLTPEQVEMP